MQTETLAAQKTKPFFEENVGNIMLMEHVNIQVPDQALATLFYLVGMGFTRDPHMMVGLDNMWANLGEQQFHLPTASAQVLRGHTGVVVPSLPELVERLDRVVSKLAGTRFAWKIENGYVDVTGPWGNNLRCYEPAAELGGIAAGIPYVEFTVPAGTVDGIALFYERVMLAPALVEQQDQRAVATIQIGSNQRLIFREADFVPEYDGHHFAIYVADFATPHEFLAEHDLITEEPRNNQLRFKEIIHPETGKNLFTVEHEVRSLRHVQYRRPLVNRTAGQFAEPRRMENQTVLGSVS